MSPRHNGGECLALTGACLAAMDETATSQASPTLPSDPSGTSAAADENRRSRVNSVDPRTSVAADENRRSRVNSVSSPRRSARCSLTFVEHTGCPPHIKAPDQARASLGDGVRGSVSGDPDAPPPGDNARESVSGGPETLPSKAPGPRVSFEQEGTSCDEQVRGPAPIDLDMLCDPEYVLVKGKLRFQDRGRLATRHCALYVNRFDAWDREFDMVRRLPPQCRIMMDEVQNVEIVSHGFVVTWGTHRSRKLGVHVGESEDPQSWTTMLVKVLSLPPAPDAGKASASSPASSPRMPGSPRMPQNPPASPRRQSPPKTRPPSWVPRVGGDRGPRHRQPEQTFPVKHPRKPKPAEPVRPANAAFYVNTHNQTIGHNGYPLNPLKPTGRPCIEITNKINYPTKASPGPLGLDTSVVHKITGPSSPRNSPRKLSPRGDPSGDYPMEKIGETRSLSPRGRLPRGSPHGAAAAPDASITGKITDWERAPLYSPRRRC